MISSLTYMLTAVRLGRLITPNAQSLQYKQALFMTSLISTIGLIIFFLKHRLLCHDLGKKHDYKRYIHYSFKVNVIKNNTCRYFEQHLVGFRYVSTW